MYFSLNGKRRDGIIAFDEIDACCNSISDREELGYDALMWILYVTYR